MRIVHLTPHLPPDQAANALLPFQLGEWARDKGDMVSYVAHPPRSGGAAPLPGPVTWIPERRANTLQRWLRLRSMASAWQIVRSARPVIAGADLVHLHSNGLLTDVGSWLAARSRKPVVLTLYGTEIWHYRRRRPDPFARAYRHADVVTFYSDGLLHRARDLGLDRPRCTVVYPPVAPSFHYHDEAAQLEARRALGLTERHVLVNVKRLHPLAGQRFLIEALPAVLREQPDARLVICGTGALLSDLEATARAAGVDSRVTFAGLVDNSLVAQYCAAADLFVLPSLLEALPTVAVEALASGTPVLSSDNPGGLELHGIFGEDVEIVPREQPLPLAEAIVRRLSHKRRTLAATQSIVKQQFRASSVAAAYWTVYREAMGRT